MENVTVAEYRVFVKNLKDGKRTTVAVSDIWVIEQVKKDLWKRNKLEVESVAKFKEKMAAEKKGKPDNQTEFGIVHGQSMVKHYIIDLAENSVALKSSVKATRPPDPKRLSTSDAAVPLMYFTNFEEKECAQKASKGNSKAQHKVFRQNDSDNILARFNRKQASNSKDPKDSSKSEEPQKIEGIVIADENSNTIVKASSLPERKKDEHADPTVIASEEPTEVSDIETEVKNLKISNRKLVRKVVNVCNQRDKALTEAEALRLRVSSLEKELADLKKAGEAAPNELLKKIADKVMHYPGTREACKLDSLVYACPLEEGFKDFQVPDKEVYVGNGRTVKKTDIIDIEDNFTSINKRGELVFNLVCPDGIQNYSLNLHRNCKGATKKITKDVKSAVTKIMRTMDWGHDVNFNVDIVKFFQKQPGEVRRNLNPKGRKEKGDKKGENKENKENDKNKTPKNSKKARKKKDKQEAAGKSDIEDEETTDNAKPSTSKRSQEDTPKKVDKKKAKLEEEDSASEFGSADETKRAGEEKHAIPYNKDWSDTDNDNKAEGGVSSDSDDEDLSQYLTPLPATEGNGEW